MVTNIDGDSYSSQISNSKFLLVSASSMYSILVTILDLFDQPPYQNLIYFLGAETENLVELSPYLILFFHYIVVFIR